MIQIDLKLFDKQDDLALEAFLCLCVLYEEPERFSKVYAPILSVLENSEYIRIVDDVCIMDHKTITLFESNPLVKQAKDILNYMNEIKKIISTRPFSYGTHGKDVLSRLNEGYEPELIKNVVKFMYDKWIGTEWQMYLRPATLFNKTKFANYVEMWEQNKNKGSNSIHELV
ncbi:MAG: conserved phage C-terminal domain-containing protein [Candidatus Omnitrophica bacterium]|jgi:uncharacterized phage protein (TIGR02220 family)|nr:conserved phage C-terminal domain-containing protein [Candidatus Omnitrophota bacterium]